MALFVLLNRSLILEKGLIIMSNFLTKSKKAILLSTASFLTLVAATNVYQADNQETTYLVQGASKSTMTSLVQQAGGEVIQDIDVIQAISAELTESELNKLTEMNPLLRVTNNAETAGFVWGAKKTGTTRVAGFVWGAKKTGTTRVAGFVWGAKKTGTTRVAGFVWGAKKTGTTRVAGFVWGAKKTGTTRAV